MRAEARAIARSLPGALLALTVAGARADVVETTRQETYLARHRTGDGLLQTLNNASPIREDGRTFHGHTRWHVRWNFRWRARADGGCEMTTVATTLDVTITLPRLRTDDADTAAEFKTFVRALAAHEEGHRALAQETAATIDRTLMALHSVGPCKEFTARANGIADDLVHAAQLRERLYDIETNHGCKQGACLPERPPGR